MKTKPKKILALITSLFVLCLILSACDPGSYNFKSEDLSDVISIELINYDNSEQKHFTSWVPDHTSDLKPFDVSKMSNLKILDEDSIPDFIGSLCECKVLYKYYAYDSPNGICIKLNYSDGEFLIIWSNYNKNSYVGYIGKFSEDGEVTEFIGCFESIDYYKDLVNNYFQTQI